MSFFEVGGTVEKLPFSTFVLRGALDGQAQAALASRIGALSQQSFAHWPEIACCQDHPIIVASNCAVQKERPISCVRACGLKRCTGREGSFRVLPFFNVCGMIDVKLNTKVKRV